MSREVELSRRGFIVAAAAASVVPVIARAVPAQAASSRPGMVVRASDFGDGLTDGTPALQAALDSSASTVIIDRVPGGWTSGPLFLRRGDVTVIFDPGVMVRALAGGFPNTTDCLLSVSDQSNVVISGYGAVLAMNKPEYTTGEWRHALALRSVQNVTVEGLVLRDSGGDGVYIGRSGSTAYCGGLTLRDLVCDNNRRNAVSVTSVVGLTVDGCAFTSTNGTSPQLGVDFEPNYADDHLESITFSDCVFEDNVTGGIELNPAKLAASAAAVSIVIERTTVGRQVGGSPSVMIANVPDGLQGTFELRDSLVDVYPGSGAVGIFGKSANSVQAVFTRTTWWDWGNAFDYWEPFVVSSGLANQPGQFANYGGVTITDGVMVTDQPAPCFRAYDEGDNALTDVHGTLTVTDPNGVSADFGQNPQNVDLMVRSARSGDQPTVRIRSVRGAVAGGQTASVTVVRSGGDMSTALAIAYETSGTARERYDYGGLGGVAVIPPNRSEVTINVRTFPRRKDTDPRVRCLTIAVAPGKLYEASPVNAASIRII